MSARDTSGWRQTCQETRGQQMTGLVVSCHLLGLTPACPTVTIYRVTETQTVAVSPTVSVYTHTVTVTMSPL